MSATATISVVRPIVGQRPMRTGAVLAPASSRTGDSDGWENVVGMDQTASPETDLVQLQRRRVDRGDRWISLFSKVGPPRRPIEPFRSPTLGSMGSWACGRTIESGLGR